MDLCSHSGCFSTVYEQAIAAGADDITANAQATAFIASPAGQAQVEAVATGFIEANPNIYAKNGSSTVPTKLQTFEIGLRGTLKSNISIETNVYYTNVSDGVGVTPQSAAWSTKNLPHSPAGLLPISFMETTAKAPSMVRKHPSSISH